MMNENRLLLNTHETFRKPRRFMINFAIPGAVDVPSEIEQANIFVADRILCVKLPEYPHRVASCVIYKMSGEVETSGKITQGLNVIKHSFDKGSYLVTLSMGRKMIINKVEIK